MLKYFTLGHTLLMFLGCSYIDHFGTNISEVRKGVVRIKNASGKVGTGFIIRTSRQDKIYIITASHVIEDPDPKVEFYGNEEYVATVATVLKVEEDFERKEEGDLGLLWVERGDLDLFSFRLSEQAIDYNDEFFTFGFSGTDKTPKYSQLTYSSQESRIFKFKGTVQERYSGGPILVKKFGGYRVIGMVISKVKYDVNSISARAINEFLTGLIPKSNPINTVITPP